MKPKTKKNNNLIDLMSLYLPVILWASLIYYFSSLSQVKVSEFFFWDYVAKKIAHLSIYGILFILILRATKIKWLLSFVLTMAYAVSDEYHQSFVTGRSASVLDLGFDLSGANIAAYTVWKLKQVRLGKHKK